ncbi:MAG: hypothetical protein IJN07_07070 [Clostridia bacterium]|nr:hypothetical protein [Clostridia bacterium]
MATIAATHDPRTKTISQIFIVKAIRGLWCLFFSEIFQRYNNPGPKISNNATPACQVFVKEKFNNFDNIMDPIVAQTEKIKYGRKDFIYDSLQTLTQGTVLLCYG